jgi:hypothetical protein
MSSQTTTTNGKIIISQTRQPAMVRKLDVNTWNFTHGGVVGRVRKAWSANGWRYLADELRGMNGNILRVPPIQMTHKNLNDAIHHAHQHVMYHGSKK